MNPEQQRIAIAEACGWTEIEPCTCCYGVSRGYTPTPGAHKKHLPDYLNDLNAMHDAEKVLKQRWSNYCEKLLEIVEPEPRSLEVCHYWNLLHATASQRAEAFLRTIGKWEESK